MVDRVYTGRQRVVQYPFNDLWVENPFDSNVRIKNRGAGYKPLPKFIVYDQEKEEEYIGMFQSSSDIILPRSLNYRKYRTIVEQP